MKKIINGKTYDTSKAKRIGDWDNDYPRNDFHYCEETLYQKKTGEFFLHGEGGGLSKYACREADGMTWGEQIIPLSFDEAREWSESKLDADVYIGIFGEPEEDDSKTLLSAYIRKDMFDRIKQEAAKSGKTVSVLVEELLTVSMKGV